MPGVPEVPKGVQDVLERGWGLKKESPPAVRGRSRWRRQLDLEEYQARQRCADAILGYGYEEMRRLAPKAFAYQRGQIGIGGVIEALVNGLRRYKARGWSYPDPVLAYGPYLDEVEAGDGYNG